MSSEEYSGSDSDSGQSMNSSVASRSFDFHASQEWLLVDETECDESVSDASQSSVSDASQAGGTRGRHSPRYVSKGESAGFSQGPGEGKLVRKKHDKSLQHPPVKHYNPVEFGDHSANMVHGCKTPKQLKPVGVGAHHEKSGLRQNEQYYLLPASQVLPEQQQFSYVVEERIAQEVIDENVITMFDASLSGSVQGGYSERALRGEHSDSQQSYRSHSRNHGRPRSSRSLTQSPMSTRTNDSRRSRRRSHRSHKHKRRHKKVPEMYDGKNMEWLDYFLLFEEISDWNGWDEADKASQLKMSLRGQALRVVNNLPKDQKRTYLDICQALQDQFCPEEILIINKEEFRSRSIDHQNQEKAREYAEELRRLAFRAFPFESVQDLESKLLDQFVHGLFNDRQKEQVVLSDPKTLAQAVKVATRWEAIKATSKHNKKPVNQAEVSKPQGQNGKKKG